MRRARGFTLLEVLVAISIFALLGVASYRVLSSVMATDEALAQRNEELRRINRAFWVMQQDIDQLRRRSVRDSSGREPNWLVVAADDPLPLQLTRGGRMNPLALPRSDMQRVAYAVDHHPDYEKEDSEHYHEETLYLLRYIWPMLDGSGDKADAQVQVLLPDVEAMTLSVQSNQGLLQEWPPTTTGQGNVQPKALRIELQFARWGAVQRWYKLF